MKKIAAIGLALVLSASSAIGALAATVDQDSDANPGTHITYTHTNDPTYTITIPSAIALNQDGTEVDIEASNVQDLNGKSISVTVAGTNYYRNQFVLEYNPGKGPITNIRYSLTLNNGSVLETTGGKDEHVGKELVRFEGDGTESYTMTPIIKSDTVVGADYTGTLTYGIALV